MAFKYSAVHVKCEHVKIKIKKERKNYQSNATKLSTKGLLKIPLCLTV